MVRRLRARYSNMKLRAKVMLVILTAVAIVAVSSAAGVRFVVEHYNDLLYSTMAHSLSLFTREIEANIDSVSSASAYVISNGTIQENLETMARYPSTESVQYRNANRNIYHVLYTYSSWNRYVTAMTIKQGDSLITRSSDSRQISRALCDEVEALAEERLGGVVWFNPGERDEGIILARSIRKINNLDLGELGTLIIHVDLEKIVRDAVQSAGNAVPSFIAILWDSRVLYPKDALHSPPEVPDAAASYSIQVVDGQRQFIIHTSSNQIGWVYLGISPYNDIFRSIIVANTIFGVALVLAASASFLITGSMVRSITRHFDRLVMKMDSFKRGNLEPLDVRYDYSGRQDEMGLLHRHFDEMIEEFRDLIEDNYVKQLLVKDARLKALEQQINPHFLYNTLDFIYWSARAGGDETVAQAVKSLASLMRGSLSEQADLIPLSRELEMVESYLQIQKLRFEDRLLFVRRVDEDLLATPVPKMSIQPLIENAIKYAVETSTEPCTVSLEITSGENRVSILVKNNGSQIDSNVVEKIRSRQIKPHGHGIGLANIDSRIKLIYGKEYGIETYSEAACAVVRVTLPLGAPEGRKNNGSPADRRG